MLERRWKIDWEIGKAGLEEAKWEFANPFQKGWVLKLRLWHGDRKRYLRNTQMHLVTNDAGDR